MMNLLLEWKNEEERLPLVIRGLRQVGKTYIVTQFAKENYENAFFLDFRKISPLFFIFQDLRCEALVLLRFNSAFPSSLLEVVLQMGIVD